MRKFILLECKKRRVPARWNSRVYLSGVRKRAERKMGEEGRLSLEFPAFIYCGSAPRPPPWLRGTRRLGRLKNTVPAPISLHLNAAFKSSPLANTFICVRPGLTQTLPLSLPRSSLVSCGNSIRLPFRQGALSQWAWDTSDLTADVDQQASRDWERHHHVPFPFVLVTLSAAFLTLR